ncbi:MAG: hypothetical protein U1F16_06640 [Turneriella sp.]
MIVVHEQRKTAETQCWSQPRSTFMIDFVTVIDINRIIDADTDSDRYGDEVKKLSLMPKNIKRGDKGKHAECEKRIDEHEFFQAAAKPDQTAHGEETEDRHHWSLGRDVAGNIDL